jgi:sec-independent protein translocase protein TatB
MFNIGTGEFILIAVAALLILGPTRLPEFARGIGKFIREFRRQTDDVKNVVEREFYRMDEAVTAEPSIQPSVDSYAHEPHLDEQSQLMAGAPDGQPVQLSLLEQAAPTEPSTPAHVTDEPLATSPQAESNEPPAKVVTDGDTKA